MKERGSKAQGVFEDFVIEMTQQSHNIGVKPKAANPAANPPAPLQSAQLVATTDPSIQEDFLMMGEHVARVETRLTTMKRVLTRLLKKT